MKCQFCKPKPGEPDYPNNLLDYLPTKDFKSFNRCKRGIYMGKYCFATLAPEQYTKGHTLVIVKNSIKEKNHIKDVTDEQLMKDTNLLRGLIEEIHTVAKHLKKKLKARRIYVCSLCDGVEHLHFHLIPRRSIFDTTGFSLMGDHEKTYTFSELWQKSDEERAEEFKKLAKELKINY